MIKVRKSFSDRPEISVSSPPNRCSLQDYLYDAENHNNSKFFQSGTGIQSPVRQKWLTKGRSISDPDTIVDFTIDNSGLYLQVFYRTLYNHKRNKGVDYFIR